MVSNHYMEAGMTMQQDQSRHNKIIREVELAVGRAQTKFPGWPKDVVHGAAIVAEEAGELVRAALDWNYERELNDVAMREEALHTAATAIRFLKALDGAYLDDTRRRKQGLKGHVQ